MSLIWDLLEVSGSLGLMLVWFIWTRKRHLTGLSTVTFGKCYKGLASALDLTLAKFKVLYKVIESVLKMNGGLCEPFKVTRGIRQGYSMSGMFN